jgi:hypothetical protein
MIGLAPVASLWLLICLLISIYAWASSRRLAALSLPIAALLAAWAVYVPLGQPRPGPPPKGQYAILGLDIKEKVFIKVLLKGANGEALLYVLPYSNKKASELQGAQDDAQAGGGQPQATFGGDGDMTVGVAGKPEAVKPPEAPATAPF